MKYSDVVSGNECYMSYAATINYWLRAQGYDGTGLQPVSDRFVMTDEEKAAARRGNAIDAMERSAYDMATIRHAAKTKDNI